MTKNLAAVALGKLKSPKKAESSRRNGKLGGKPKKCACGHSFKLHNEIGECCSELCRCVAPTKC